MLARLVAVLVLFIAPLTAFGWGGDGHQIVALIAENHLSPAAQAAIRGLLGDAHISDAAIVNWADDLRREKKETSPWHYVDIPVDAKAFDPKRDGKGGNNVIDQLEKFERILASPSSPKADKVEALKFVVHFVGDIHQPLHCADRNGDGGGNGRLVWMPDGKKAVSLHSCWDSAILLQRKKEARVADYAKTLDRQVSAEKAKELAKGSATDWANESHRVAVERVYADIPAGGPPPKLSSQYLKDSGQVIDEQLAKAGIRLASVLNNCFKGR